MSCLNKEIYGNNFPCTPDCVWPKDKSITEAKTMTKLEEVCKVYGRFQELLKDRGFTSEFVGLVPSQDKYNSDTVCMMFGSADMVPFRELGCIIHVATLDLEPIDVMIKMYNYCIKSLDSIK